MVTDWLGNTDRPAIVNNQARIIDDLTPPESQDGGVAPLMNEPPPAPRLETPPAAESTPMEPPAVDLEDIEGELDQLGLEPDRESPLVRRSSRTSRRPQ